MIGNIYFLWFGDHIPDYAYWSMNNHKTINKNWTIKFITYNSNEIKNYKDIGDEDLEESIKWCFKTYSTNFSFNDISNRYRYRILKNNYDIYLDLDTFPISEIDNFILRDEKYHLKFFRNVEYSYCRDGRCNDIWFIARTDRSYTRICNISKEIDSSKNIICYKSTYMNECEMKKYDLRCKDFINMKLEIGSSFCFSFFSPVEHLNVMHRNYNSLSYVEQKKLFDKVLI